jgi:hypothetical protein
VSGRPPGRDISICGWFVTKSKQCGGGVGVVDWVYVIGVWSIGVLIYAVLLNSQSHLVDGYGSVCQCMPPFGGREGRRDWLCVIF